MDVRNVLIPTWNITESVSHRGNIVHVVHRSVTIQMTGKHRDGTTCERTPCEACRTASYTPMAKSATEGLGWKLTLAGRHPDGTRRTRPNILLVTGHPAGRAYWDRTKSYYLPARMNMFDFFIDVLLRPHGDFIIVVPVDPVGRYWQERFFDIPNGIGVQVSKDMRDYAVKIR